MKFAVAQINFRVGDVALNADKVRSAVAQAQKNSCDLLVCPELVLTGYPPRDLLDYSSLIDENLSALKAIAPLVHGVVACVGFVERNSSSKGKPFFNAVAVIRDGKIETISRKQLLPYYGVFDDERYFEPGATTSVIEVRGKKIALLVCEDIWNLSGFVTREYPVHPLDAAKKAKADFVINISASPFHLGKAEDRNALFQQVAKETGAGLLFCNAVGANDDILFDGGSFGMMPDGKLFGYAPVFQEGVFIFDSEKPQLPPEATWPERDEEWHFEALTLGIRDYFLKNGQKRAVIGLSGGIDSSVVAVLAVKALGAENVLGVMLPSRFTAEISNSDAQTLAANLGIRVVTCPIETARLEFSNALAAVFPTGLKSITQENVQPRIRMTLLMAIANEWGALLLNTSNKSEISAGFATLYGDSAGALSPIGDLTKGQVYRLGKFINQHGEMIPSGIFGRAPTAELRENQTDQDVLPPYDELDALVRAYVEEGQLPQKPSGISAGSQATFAKLHGMSEYKRKQFPPILRVSKKAFGCGRRMPVTASMPGLNG